MLLLCALLLGYSAALLDRLPSLQAILGKIGGNARSIPRPVSIYMYDIPEELLHAGGTKNLTTCPFNFYSSEIFIPQILQQRMPPSPTEDVFLDPESVKYDYYLVPQYSACHYHQCIERKGADRTQCRRDTNEYMKKILDHVEGTWPFWERHQGIDHLFIFTWDEASSIFPDSFLRSRLASSIHLTHLGYPEARRNFDPTKDICIPALRDFHEAEKTPNRFETSLPNPAVARPLFAYFRGTIWKTAAYGRGIRTALKQMGDAFPDRFFVKEKHSLYYWNEITRARFSLCPPGWSAWSPRLFDAIVAGSIPVIISDDWVPPFAGILNYADFSIRVKEDEVDKLPEILAAISPQEEARLRRNLQAVYERFVYSLTPYGTTDAFESIYETLVGKKRRMEEAVRAMLELPETEASDQEGVIQLDSSDEESVNDLGWVRVEL